MVLGIRLSIEGGEEAGLTLDGLCELLPLADALFDYVNLTVASARPTARTWPPRRRHCCPMSSVSARS